MSERIAVGDLVMVIKATDCCNYAGACGIIGKVTELGDHSVLCGHCGNVAIKFRARIDSRSPKNGRWRSYQIHRLKRIPPLTEPESVEHGAGVTA